MAQVMTEVQEFDETEVPEEIPIMKQEIYTNAVKYFFIALMITTLMDCFRQGKLVSFRFLKQKLRLYVMLKRHKLARVSQIKS